MPVLGIDTSCYTTSAAVVDGSDLITDRRIPLKVPERGRGLQQSNALFQHVQNLPALIGEIGLPGLGVRAVVASVRPRPAEGSYMPVFTAGQSIGKVLSAALGARYFETSHQEGHIAAGCFSLGWKPDAPFLAFHISGGTTELLSAEPAQAGFRLAVVGGTTDLHAGQVVDRVGVALGLTFPAGPALESMAAEYKGEPGLLRLKANVSGSHCSLSGLESAAQRLIAAGADSAAVACGVLDCLAGAFASMAKSASGATGLRELLVVGGVASNAHIRKRLSHDLGKAGVRTMFALNPFSSDNAVGVAAIGQNFLERGAV